ncbi:hypothetical protein IC229_20160 [Spirosoma sp. BT702]|uniref:SbsA Ig-like domain-containing protein n=1 Tax=Spirosoma profusum TaxID=2771354 RepID=A0A927AU84_9BACT|nr:hypothetical protein [Spirosoma profusum]MBD2702972.1 hypothetical protein [Spirosoma profusum]
MNGISKNYKLLRIRLCTLYSLVFFTASLLVTCRSGDKTGLVICWNDNRATGLVIPERYVVSIAPNSLSRLLSVRRQGVETAIAGQFQRSDEGMLFEPLVPFTRGLVYELWLRNKRLSEIEIPALADSDRPFLKGIYPSADTLPENLLKVYLQFSRPMREGQSLRYVTLLKNGTDTLSGTFLDLQPELWDADRTMLTLWLDPGRIKRNLHPNQQLGAPLQAGTTYRLVVSGEWPDAQGATLGKTLSKTFVTDARDGVSPDPMQWSMNHPPPGTSQPLVITFPEPLDYSLLLETFRIRREDSTLVSGTWRTSFDEEKIVFSSAKPWLAGNYTLRIESRLEDLAGNNLNRPFDRDITQNKSDTTFQVYKEKRFQIR